MAFDSVADGYLNSLALAACFDARATVARMLEFEAALAHAEAVLGVIPPSAAAVITAACTVEGFDLDAIKRGSADSSSAAIPLVAQLTARVAAVDAAAAHYVHWGSSTQDVMDTAMMLQVRAGIDCLSPSIHSIADRLAALTDTHRVTPMVARTLSQHALPTTFGYKCALWLDAMLSAAAELARVRALLPLQFGGAAGTLAAFGTQGLALRDAVANALALRAVPPWHTDRSTVRAVAAALATAAASAGKLAHDLILMQQTEVAELAEAAGGGSSALPHKRNPVATVAVTAGAHRVPGMLAAVFACYDHSHERATGAWHAEWSSLRELFVTVGSMLEQLARACADLSIDVVAMAANLRQTRGFVMSEAVAMALAPHLGRSDAQHLVKTAVMTAVAQQLDLDQVLAANAVVRNCLGAEGLARALDPTAYLGAVSPLIDGVLARYAAARGAV